MNDTPMIEHKLKFVPKKIWEGKKRRKQNVAPAKQPSQIILESSNATMTERENHD
jgi:rRNA pseudouridine-1189 N-methylase Emg1 (Nep1/Mra1 family)